MNQKTQNTQRIRVSENQKSQKVGKTSDTLAF